MPELALALCAVWFCVLFVARSLVQWARTGKIGVHGFRGRIGSAEWTAGTLVSLGLVLAPLACLAPMYGWPLGQLLLQQPLVHAAGVGISLIGILGAAYAQGALGDSWRVGVDPGERTKLVTKGIYNKVRNPIFTFVGVSLVGLVLVVPNVWSVLTLVVVWLGVELQVRKVEEPHLHRVHGQAYAEYVARVGRFWPA